MKSRVIFWSVVAPVLFSLAIGIAVQLKRYLTRVEARAVAIEEACYLTERGKGRSFRGLPVTAATERTVYGECEGARQLYENNSSATCHGNVWCYAAIGPAALVTLSIPLNGETELRKRHMHAEALDHLRQWRRIDIVRIDAPGQPLEFILGPKFLLNPLIMAMQWTLRNFVLLILLGLNFLYFLHLMGWFPSRCAREGADVTESTVPAASQSHQAGVKSSSAHIEPSTDAERADLARRVAEIDARTSSLKRQLENGKKQ
ncbi:MAG: hypothetical protein LCH61_17370 [Proteobacteria bacterium]|nr:hypothetical protein [Pseudomonadota bacterium]